MGFFLAYKGDTPEGHKEIRRGGHPENGEKRWLVMIESKKKCKTNRQRGGK